MKAKIKAKILLGLSIVSCINVNIFNCSKIYAAGGNPSGTVRPRYSEDATAINTPKLFSLIQHNKISKVKQMLRSGVNVNTLRNGPNWTPLHFAVIMGRYEIVRYLVERCHASLRARDSGGNTPVQLAIIHDEEQIRDYLNQRLSQRLSRKVRWHRTKANVRFHLLQR